MALVILRWAEFVYAPEPRARCFACPPASQFRFLDPVRAYCADVVVARHWSRSSESMAKQAGRATPGWALASMATTSATFFLALRSSDWASSSRPAAAAAFAAIIAWAVACRDAAAATSRASSRSSTLASQTTVSSTQVPVCSPKYRRWATAPFSRRVRMSRRSSPYMSPISTTQDVPSAVQGKEVRGFGVAPVGLVSVREMHCAATDTRPPRATAKDSANCSSPATYMYSPRPVSANAASMPALCPSPNPNVCSATSGHRALTWVKHRWIPSVVTSPLLAIPSVSRKTERTDVRHRRGFEANCWSPVLIPPLKLVDPAATILAIVCSQRARF
mmetsp:Transcript_53383/g.117206  ORF Transcript_53383/g.117206 Transcript_53383/m.117206 type:complete len:333 (-) Transcript_53383:562-1560(-)